MSKVAGINDAKIWMWKIILQAQNEKIEELIDKGFPVDTPISPIGLTALHLACAKDNAEAVRILIGKSANVNAVDGSGRTPLHMAASESRDSAECVSLLVEAGADKDAESTGGETPLMKALYFARPHAIKFLIEAGCDTSKRSKSDRGLKEYADATRNQEIIDFVQPYL